MAKRASKQKSVKKSRAKSTRSKHAAGKRDALLCPYCRVVLEKLDSEDESDDDAKQILATVYPMTTLEQPGIAFVRNAARRWDIACGKCKRRFCGPALSELADRAYEAGRRSLAREFRSLLDVAAVTIPVSEWQ
jgi:hypothetical protein